MLYLLFLGFFLVDIRQIAYSLLFERHVLRGMLASVKIWPRIWKKRRATMKARVARPKDLRKWFR